MPSMTVPGGYEECLESGLDRYTHFEKKERQPGSSREAGFNEADFCSV